MSEAASAGGFESAKVWSDYVMRRVRKRPSLLLRDGGFDGLLDRCAEEGFPNDGERESSPR